MESFSVVLRAQMAKRGLRGLDVAALCGVSESTVSRWLAGTVPGYHRLQRLIASGIVTRDVALTFLAPFDGADIEGAVGE